MLDVPLTSTQSQFLQSKLRNVSYRGGIGAGKSFILTLLAIIQAAQGRTVLYVAPTFKMLRDVAIPLYNQHINKFSLQETTTIIVSPPQITFKNGGVILMRSAEQGDTLRGINAHDVLLDEAGYIPLEILKIVKGRARNSEDGLIRAVGTPSGDTHWFSDFGDKILTQTTLANPFIPDAYKTDLIQSYGGLSNPWARQELLGEVIGNLAPDALIEIIKWSDALTRPWVRNGNLVCSLDPARFGDDKSAIVIRDGNGLVYAETRDKTSGDDLTEWLQDLYAVYGFKHLIVDTAGVGGLWYDTIKKIFPLVQCHDFNGARTKGISKRVKNARAESWVRVKNFIEDYGHLGNPEIAHQLQNFKTQISEQKKFYNDGKLQLLAKEEMRRKGINSPDLGDALAMSLMVDETQSSREVMDALYSF